LALADGVDRQIEARDMHVSSLNSGMKLHCRI